MPGHCLPARDDVLLSTPRYRFEQKKQQVILLFFHTTFSFSFFPPPPRPPIRASQLTSHYRRKTFHAYFRVDSDMAFIDAYLLLFDRVPLMSELYDSRLCKRRKKKLIVRNDFPLSGLMCRLARQLEKICFYLFSSVWQQITRSSGLRFGVELNTRCPIMFR